ncbi:hypothetical protein FVEN_g12644 [Fusarium venenatum]|uniref:uncharacterized protein n=1 Tax=Fusarium venenatum TaxID=56646 RepID=UPI001D2D26DD|nr:hypothetical protein FVEN_g12644 [Fusarium venenatum]KAH6967430.1 hypothetical protein EDB82DRAFT_531112 [Fusarium venenatum]
MKCQLFLALSGALQAAANLELIGEPGCDDGVICYTYLSTYLAPVGAATDLPTAHSFPTTRGIIPPSFSNQSTSALQPITNSASIMENPTSGIYIFSSSGLPIVTDDPESRTTAT